MPTTEGSTHISTAQSLLWPWENAAAEFHNASWSPQPTVKVRSSLRFCFLSCFPQGFGVTWARTLGLMTTYFIMVDSGRRHFPDQFSRPLLGPFLTSGIAATLGWWLVWPLEYMKAQVQGNYGE